MVYFNYIATGLIAVFILIAALVKKRRPLSERFDRLIESRRFEIAERSEYMEEDGIRYQFVKYVKVPPEGGRR